MYRGDSHDEHQPSSHSIQTIPEGSSVGQSPCMPKSPSPSYLSSTTTGTSTTPTSIENTSLSNGEQQQQQVGNHNLTHAVASDAAPPAHWANTVNSRFATHSSGYGPSEQELQMLQQHQQQQQLPPQPHHHPQMQQLLQDPQARYNPANYTTAIKLLVSNNVAGSIIGRAGQTISELQSQSSTRIKLSQTGDYYPGTQDRVCLVQGDPENVKSALRLLLERFHMLQEHQHSQLVAWQLQKSKGAAAPAFDFVVRVLVPSSSCGMIIGKSGSNIKFMEETTGVSSVRLSPKDSVEGGYPSAYIIQATSERIVTVTAASLESCLQCLFLILDGMATHPDICRYANMTTSYTRVMTDAYAAAAPQRPVMVSAAPASPRLASPVEQQMWEGMPPPGHYGGGLPNMSRRIASSPDLPGFVLNQRGSALGFLKEPQTPERLQGYSPGGYSPVQVPMTPSNGAHSLYLFPQGPPPPMDLAGTGDMVHHSVSAPDLLAAQMEQSMHLAPHPAETSATPIDMSGIAPQTPMLTSPGCFTSQVLVPDSMIGSILGRGGHTLSELQMHSGTRIRISQRGEYMPGTRSRIVTVRGPTAQAVWQAQFMMSQRIVLPPTATYSQQQQQQQHSMSGQSSSAPMPPQGEVPSDSVPTPPVASHDPSVT